jgi:hypothetical protein
VRFLSLTVWCKTFSRTENRETNYLVCFFLVQIFFEGVQEKIAAGVKAEEVGYQLAFSKQELRKCIKEYPAKEVSRHVLGILVLAGT